MVDLGDLLKGLDLNDFALDPSGRVVLSNDAIAEQLKAAGRLGNADLAAKGDTNIICCGNKSCAASDELGSMVERFAPGLSR